MKIVNHDHVVRRAASQRRQFADDWTLVVEPAGIARQPTPVGIQPEQFRHRTCGDSGKQRWRVPAMEGNVAMNGSGARAFVQLRVPFDRYDFTEPFRRPGRAFAAKSPRLDEDLDSQSVSTKLGQSVQRGSEDVPHHPPDFWPLNAGSSTAERDRSSAFFPQIARKRLSLTWTAYSTSSRPCGGSRIASSTTAAVDR